MSMSQSSLHVLKQAVATDELWVVVRKDGYAAMFVGESVWEVIAQANQIWGYPNDTKLAAHLIQALEVEEHGGRAAG